MEERRRCIENEETGARWLELAYQYDEDGGLLKPVLHTCHDLGTLGAPGISWWIHRLGANATDLWDRCHVITCEWNDAEKLAHLAI